MTILFCTTKTRRIICKKRSLIFAKFSIIAEHFIDFPCKIERLELGGKNMICHTCVRQCVSHLIHQSIVYITHAAAAAFHAGIHGVYAIYAIYIPTHTYRVQYRFVYKYAPYNVRIFAGTTAQIMYTTRIIITRFSRIHMPCTACDQSSERCASRIGARRIGGRVHLSFFPLGSSRSLLLSNQRAMKRDTATPPSTNASDDDDDTTHKHTHVV